MKNDPYRPRFTRATSTTNGTHASVNTTKRRRPAVIRAAGTHTSSAAGKTINGARFGRTKIATPAAIPDRAAEAYGRFHHAKTSATVQNAAAGTSLIGHNV